MWADEDAVVGGTHFDICSWRSKIQARRVREIFSRNQRSKSLPLMTRITRIFTDSKESLYRKGREGHREDPYRGFTRMGADLPEPNHTTDYTDDTDFH